ncbi:hypothetical protein UCDDA912_g04149 [Diaporthe ampelina]|uniref:Uncharacterized protein n=1 Tax=Diaporthe ampelina TaxID=1214573 RepID=A0A0G2FPC7_9PEZI|nr:hypothetical protein UCDDA912_g04149 [Diaporthe ampelina]
MFLNCNKQASASRASGAAGGGLLSGLTGGISSALSGLGKSLLEDGGGASMYLGIGLEAGAAQGLNVAPAGMAQQVAAKVVADLGMNATGLNPAIQNAAMGATASLFGSVNVSSLIERVGANLGLNGLALGAANGIGNGVSSGLKLSPQAMAMEPPKGKSTADIANTFGFALTKSLASNFDTSKLSAKSINISQIIPSVGMTAMSIGSGLGSGAAAGLNLASAVVNPPDPKGKDVPSVVGNFAFGLTKSVVENVNLTQLTSGNSTLARAARNIDIGRAAQGVAMGLVQGAGDAVNSMGGLQALINGTATMPPAGAVKPDMLAFNDTLGGAATGLGTGLGGQGTLVGVQLFSQLNVTSLLEGLVGNNTGPAGAAAPSSGTSALPRRSIHEVLSSAILPRQGSGVTTVSNGNSFNLSVVFNAGTISSVAQRVISALTCEGQVVPKALIKITSDGNEFAIDGQKVINNIQGNLLSAANGISINGDTAIRFAAFLVIHIVVALSVFLAVIPLILSLEGTRALLVRLKLGHLFPKVTRCPNIGWFWVMGPATLLILIFGVLAAGTSGHMRTAHGILGLITVLVALGATGFQVFTKLYISANTPFPGSEASVLPAPSTFADRRTISTLLSQTLLGLTMPTLISGFADLASITLCTTRVVPFEAAFAVAVSLTALYTTGSGISMLNILLAIFDIRKAKKEAADGRDEENRGRKTLKEKIQYVGQVSQVKLDGQPGTFI